MKEIRAGFSPRLRPKEEFPQAPKGKELTRVCGELVFVSAKGDESRHGNSPYTRTQLDEIAEIIKKRRESYIDSSESSGGW